MCSNNDHGPQTIPIPGSLGACSVSDWYLLKYLTNTQVTDQLCFLKNGVFKGKLRSHFAHLIARTIQSIVTRFAQVTCY